MVVSPWGAVWRGLPWVVGAALLLATLSEVTDSVGSLADLWSALGTRPGYRRSACVGLGLVVTGGLLSVRTLYGQIVWSLLVLALGGLLAWRVLGRRRSPREAEVASRAPSPVNYKADRRTAWMRRVLDGIELGVVTLAAPVLWFPTLRPQLTVLALVALGLTGIAVALWSGRLWPRSPYDLTLIVLLGMASVGAYVSPAPVLTLQKVTGLLLGLALYRLVLRLADSRGRYAAALYLTLGLVAGFAVIGLANGLPANKVPGLGTWIARLPRLLQALPGAERGRASLNQLGGALLYALPLAVALAVAPVSKGAESWRVSLGQRVLALGFALALGLALILTQSRAAWTGMAVGLLCLVALRWLWGKWIVLGLGIGLLAWGLANGVSLRTRLNQLLVGDVIWTSAVGTLNLSGRASIWERAVACVRAQPLTGCGLGAFRALDADLTMASSPFDVGTPHAHQVFLQVAVDTGLPGLVAYLALLILAWRQSWRLYRQAQGAPRAVALGALAALLGSHIYGLADVVALGSKPGVLWWALLGLIAVLARKDELC